VLFFVCGHVPPLFGNVSHLLLDKWIASLFGPRFALKRLRAVLFGLARHSASPSVRYMTNVTGEESFHRQQKDGGRQLRRRPHACGGGRRNSSNTPSHKRCSTAHEAGLEILVPAAEGVLQRWPVSKRVNSSKTPKDDETLTYIDAPQLRV
jgi:hypothetical protein